MFPDQNTCLFYIDLKIGSTIIKSLPFISADGGRYTLPLPEQLIVDKEAIYSWEPDSIEVKIAELIKNYYRYNSLKEVAEFTGVEFHRTNSYT